MREYTPDSWKLVKITSPKHGTIYKVLCSWYGGFASGDSWKLSSGIESVRIEDNFIRMPQSSGSLYALHKNGEHMSGIMGNVYASFQRDIEDAKDGEITLELVTLEEVMEAFKA